MYVNIYNYNIENARSDMTFINSNVYKHSHKHNDAWRDDWMKYLSSNVLLLLTSFIVCKLVFVMNIDKILITRR
jgi:hypothetical protein